MVDAEVSASITSLDNTQSEITDFQDKEPEQHRLT
jgi:hypothetical protein